MGKFDSFHLALRKRAILYFYCLILSVNMQKKSTHCTSMGNLTLLSFPKKKGYFDPTYPLQHTNCQYALRKFLRATLRQINAEVGINAFNYLNQT